MKRLLAITLAFVAISCASTEQRTRTALDVIGAVAVIDQQKKAGG